MFTNTSTPSLLIPPPSTSPTGAGVSWNTGVSTSAHPNLWITGADAPSQPSQQDSLIQELYTTQSGGRWIVNASFWVYGSGNATVYYSYL
jgi:hypothetical protein